MFGIGLDRLTYAGHVHVDTAVECLQIFAAHLEHQCIARHDPARVFGEREKQLELVTGQRAHLAVTAHFACVAIDLEPIEPKRRAAARDELEALAWMKAYFSVNDEQAHSVGASLLTFLVGLDRAAAGG